MLCDVISHRASPAIHTTRASLESHKTDASHHDHTRFKLGYCNPPITLSPYLSLCITLRVLPYFAEKRMFQTAGKRCSSLAVCRFSSSAARQQSSTWQASSVMRQGLQRNARLSRSSNRLPTIHTRSRGPRSFSSAAVATTPTFDLLHYFYFGHSQPARQGSHQQRILAMSSSTKLSTALSSLPRLLWQRLLYWWRQFYKAWSVITRSTEVMLRFSPLCLLVPLSVLTQSSQISHWTWRYSISAIQALGPVAVKFCQWVATRRDIFPPELCDRLSILHDRGLPHSFQYTHQVLVEAFGEDYEAQGLVVKPEGVIGCGSAAQVYRGSLDDKLGGRKQVAIKVLHPQFSWSIDRDLTLLETIADWLHSLPSDTIRMVNLPRAAQNFGILLRRQADLTQEANNLQNFSTNFAKDTKIVFPQPIQEWCHPKVLVEDFVGDAMPIAFFLQDSTPRGQDVRRELAGPLLRAFLKMVFIDNFIHGDLHPGNVLVKTEEVSVSTSIFGDWLSSLFPIFKASSSTATEEDTQATVPQPTETRRTIVFLDAGIANSLSRDDQRNLMDLFRAVLLNDGNRAGRLMVERAKYERCSQVPGGIDAFAKGVEDIVSEFHDRRKQGLTLGAVRIGSLLGRVLDLCRVHGVEIDPAMASVVISTLVLEGLGRSLSPELNLIDFAKPFVIGGGRV